MDITCLRFSDAGGDHTVEGDVLVKLTCRVDTLTNLELRKVISRDNPAHAHLFESNVYNEEECDVETGTEVEIIDPPQANTNVKPELADSHVILHSLPSTANFDGDKEGKAHSIPSSSSEPYSATEQSTSPHSSEAVPLVNSMTDDVLSLLVERKQLEAEKLILAAKEARLAARLLKVEMEKKTQMRAVTTDATSTSTPVTVKEEEKVKKEVVKKRSRASPFIESCDLSQGTEEEEMEVWIRRKRPPIDAVPIEEEEDKVGHS